MLTLRRAEDRGRTLLSWLDSRHTFSFGDYSDPAHAGYRALRVINDDRVAPASGFPTHAHRDMEILTYVLEGALAHRDNLGHFAVTHAGELQRMTAGTGISHSEFNHSDADAVHFLQIWILPEAKGLAPGYEHRPFKKRPGFALLASPTGREGSLRVRQDVEVRLAELAPGEEAAHELGPGRHAWIHVARGEAEVCGHALAEGDGAAASNGQRITAKATAPCTILLFDLA